MNIQIFGKSKCFDTKKAERWFKERRIKYQYIDLLRYGMSRGELNAVKNAVGLENLVNKDDQDYPLFQYLASNEARLEKLYEVPELIQSPVVRNGKQATVGYCPEIWKTWEKNKRAPGVMDSQGLSPCKSKEKAGCVFRTRLFQIRN